MRHTVSQDYFIMKMSDIQDEVDVCPRLYFNGNFLTNSHSDRTATSIHVRHDSHIFVE